MPKDIAPDAGRKRFRLPRSCLRCRRAKIKCVLEGEKCDACAAAGASCTWADPALVAERPPTRKEVEQLNARIRSLERLLAAFDPTGSHGISSNGGLSNATTPQSPPSSERDSGYSPLAGTTGDTPSHKDTPSSRGSPESDDDDSYVCFETAIDAGNYIGPRALWFPSGLPCRSAGLNVSSGAYPEIDRVFHKAAQRSSDEYSNAVYPPPDLEQQLICLYFQNVHPIFPVVHPSFIALHASGAASHMPTFRALCMVIFALASRYCTDPRVTTDRDGLQLKSRQAAGYKYAYAGIGSSMSLMQPLDLYELQTLALGGHYVLGVSSPMLTWSFYGMAIQRAQDGGAHREKSKWWAADPLRNHLRKRAFWTLFMMEKDLSAALGRSTIMSLSSFDLEAIDPSLDATFGMFQTPFNFSTRFSAAESQQTSFALTTLFRKWTDRMKEGCDELITSALGTVKRHNRAGVLDSAQACAAKLDAVMNGMTEEVRSVGLLWSPDIEEDGRLVQAANVDSAVYFFRILVLRRLCGLDRSDRVALDKCIQMSRTLIIVVSSVHQRGLLSYCWDWVPLRVSTAAIFLFWASGSASAEEATRPDAALGGRTPQEAAIEILAALAPSTYLAERTCLALSRFNLLRRPNLASASELRLWPTAEDAAPQPYDLGATLNSPVLLQYNPSVSSMPEPAAQPPIDPFALASSWRDPSTFFDTFPPQQLDISTFLTFAQIAAGIDPNQPCATSPSMQDFGQPTPTQSDLNSFAQLFSTVKTD